MNTESLGLLSSTKLLKFQTCKNKKTIASNLENVKKEKYTSLIFTRTSVLKLSLKKIFFSCEKMLGGGKAAIKCKMRSGTIVKLESSIFLVWTLEKNIFLVLHPQLLQESQDFTFKALVPRKAMEVHYLTQSCQMFSKYLR